LVHSLPCFSLFTRINSKWIRDLHVKFLFIVLLDGSIMEFTKVLILYQIYYNWIHPLYHSPLSLTPILGIFSTGLIFPFTYKWHSICTTFTLPHTFPTSTLHIGTNLPHKTGSALLFAIFVKKKINIFVSLRKLQKEFPCDISMYICIITQICFFYFLSTLVPFFW
jgi:hypothetical protein